MKRIALVIVLMAVFTSITVAQPVSRYPIGNGHVLKFTNYLNEQYQPFFDYAALAEAFAKISSDYNLSTDIDIGFNPSDKGIWLTVQGIKIDPKHSSKYRPVIEDEATYLPLKLQVDAAVAIHIWFMSFLANPAVPEDIQMLLAKVAIKSTRFLVAVENELRTLSVKGSITVGSIAFDAQFRWMDFSSGQFIMKDIKLPQTPEVLDALRKDLKLYLVTPVDPANPEAEGDTMGVYQFFGLK